MAATVLLLAAAVVLLAPVWQEPYDGGSGVPLRRQRVGECHEYVDLQELYSVSDASPAVPCSQTHSVETMSFLAVPRALARSRVRPGLERLHQATADIDCSAFRVGRYVGADGINVHWFLATDVRWPTEREWAAGERRVRCALGPGEPDGSGRRHRRGSVRGILRSPAGAEIRPCTLDGALVPCSVPHTAELFGVIPGLVADADVCALTARVFTGRDLPATRFRIAPATLGPPHGWCSIERVDGRRSSGTLAAQARSRP